jgi:hypothetical protein
MAFDVYPDPPAAPLELAPGGSSPPITFREQSRLDPVVGATRMYIAVAVSGRACAPPGPPAPTIMVQADGVPVVVSAAQPVTITGAGGAVVGRATVTDVSDGVTLIEIELVRRPGSWQIRFDNPDPAALRRFTWVVADSAAETRQPWIDAPAELDFPPMFGLGQPIALPVVIANRGTTPLVIADPPGRPIGPGLQVVAVPGPIGPAACGQLTILCIGVIPGPFAIPYAIASADPRATQAPGHNHLITIRGAIVVIG